MTNKQILYEIIIQILGFLVVLWVLRRFAFGPLLRIIDKRKQSIEDKFADLDHKQEELKKLETNYQSKLEHIEQEARLKIQQATADGARVSKEIQEKARQDAQQLVERAKADIDQELAKARVTMRDQIVEISSSLTEKIIRQKLTAKDQERLVEDFVKEMDKLS